MNDLRCRKCNKLLCRYKECLELEIKCPRCSTINSLSNHAHAIRVNKAKPKQGGRTVVSVSSDTNVG